MSIEFNRYRVWPDGSVQPTDEPAFWWMSDDFMTITAPSEESALGLARRCGYVD